MSSSPPFQQEPLSLAQAFTRYREVELPAQNKSETTRRGYLYDLAEWIRQLPVAWVQELDIGAIDAYLATLDRRGLGGTTRRSKTAAISHFLTFCEGFERLFEKVKQQPVDELSNESWQWRSELHCSEEALHGWKTSSWLDLDKSLSWDNDCSSFFMPTGSATR